MSDWHYVKGGTSVGPFSPPDMERLIAQGEIGPHVLVWNDSMPQWEPALHHFSGFQATSAPRHDGYVPIYAGAPARGFFEAGQVCFRKYASFRGRASRSEYWFFVLFCMMLGAVAGLIDGFIGALTGTSGFIGAIVSLGVVLPSIAVSVRRLHDINKSGWWIGIIFLVYIGIAVGGYLIYASGVAMTTEDTWTILFLLVAVGIALMIYSLVLMIFYCLRGTPGPNRYG